MGGGAMRAAAKVAGITAANSGFRGFTAEHSAARRAASVRPSAVSIAEDVKLVASQPQAGVQKSYSEMDDWVWAGVEEEAMGSVADPLPRVVFGGAPTLQEAKEATSELTAALEKVYLSSPNQVGYGSSFPIDHESGSSLSSSQVIENKARVTNELTVAPSVPAHAMKAFRLLNESSVAQTVVASIACDPNVWNAVLQNQELQEFLQSQQTCVSGPNMKFNVDELAVDSDFLDQASAKSTTSTPSFSDSKPENGFMDFIQAIKTTVVDMMSSLSDYFQNFFGGQGPKGIFVNSDGTAKVSGDALMEASFMGLAVMAILVILLKRA